MRRTPRRLIGTLIAAAALLVGIPASAQANLSLTGSTAKPSDLSAGAHSDFKIHVALPGTDDVKDLTISLPPGRGRRPARRRPLCTTPAQLRRIARANTRSGAVSSDGHDREPAAVRPSRGRSTTSCPSRGSRRGSASSSTPSRFRCRPPLNASILPPTVLQSAPACARATSAWTRSSTTSRTRPRCPGGPDHGAVHINSMDLTLYGIVPGIGQAVHAESDLVRRPQGGLRRRLLLEHERHGGATTSPRPTAEPSTSHPPSRAIVGGPADCSGRPDDRDHVDRPGQR